MMYILPFRASHWRDVAFEWEGAFFRSFFIFFGPFFFLLLGGVPSKARKEGMPGGRKEGRKDKKRRQEGKEER